MEKKDVRDLTVEELEEIIKERKARETELKRDRREAYELLRADLVQRARVAVEEVVARVEGLHDFITRETGAFREIMLDYGRLRDAGQVGFTLEDGGFRVIVKFNKVKGFDERADVAEKRLIVFLQGYINRTEKGVNDPMYKLAMTLLERNKHGNLDYKSISKLHDLEGQFDDPDYSEIMALFKESNTVETTATNFYFERRDEQGAWKKVEPSFNRL
jgi:hypothetical protein